MDIISSEVLFAPAPLVRADARPRTPCTSLTRAVVRPTARLHLRGFICATPPAAWSVVSAHRSLAVAAASCTAAAPVRPAPAPVRLIAGALQQLPCAARELLQCTVRPCQTCPVSERCPLAGQRCLSGRDRRLVARAQSQDIDAVCERTHAETCTSVPATPTPSWPGRLSRPQLS